MFYPRLRNTPRLYAAKSTAGNRSCLSRAPPRLFPHVQPRSGKGSLRLAPERLPGVRSADRPLLRQPVLATGNVTANRHQECVHEVVVELHDTAEP